jgi:clathrin heavy chain
LWSFQANIQVFDRHASLANNQIINYRVSDDGKWLVLVGISSNPAAGQPGSNAFKIKGSMQLYSTERGVSQPIEGHAAAFTTVKMDGAAHPSKLFCFAVRTGTGAKVSLLIIQGAILIV